MRRLLPPVAVVASAAAALVGCEETPTAREAERTVTVEIGRPSQAGSGGAASEPRADRSAPPQVPGDERCDGARAPTTSENLRQAEIAIRCLVNAARQQNGLAPLEFSEQLARAAATRSNDMVEQRYFAHQGPDGGNVRRAVRRTGYIPADRSWLLGENIGWAGEQLATPAVMVRNWLDSPTHRANILSEAYTETGVGAIAGVPTEDADAGATYTQIFGVRGPAARRAQTG